MEIGGKGYTTGRTQTRIVLVMDCYMPHDYSPKYTRMVNLQQHVIKEKKLPESLAIKIFYNVVQIVERLHKVSFAFYIKLNLAEFFITNNFFRILLFIAKHCSSGSQVGKYHNGQRYE